MTPGFWGGVAVYVVVVLAILAWIYCAAKAADDKAADQPWDEWEGWDR